MAQRVAFLASSGVSFWDGTKEIAEKIFAEYFLGEEINDFLFTTQVVLKVIDRTLDFLIDGTPLVDMETIAGDLATAIAVIAVLERWQATGWQFDPQTGLAIRANPAFMDP